MPVTAVATYAVGVVKSDTITPAPTASEGFAWARRSASALATATNVITGVTRGLSRHARVMSRTSYSRGGSGVVNVDSLLVPPNDMEFSGERSESAATTG